MSKNSCKRTGHLDSSVIKTLLPEYENILYIRMAFGELNDDEYQSDLGATRGNIGKGGVGGGSLRTAQVILMIILVRVVLEVVV